VNNRSPKRASVCWVQRRLTGAVKSFSELRHVSHDAIHPENTALTYHRLDYVGTHTAQPPTFWPQHLDLWPSGPEVRATSVCLKVSDLVSH